MGAAASIFELIDLGSFSNLWFWIALAVVWSSASHWVLGVPFDVILRAQTKGAQAQADLQDLVRINVNRIRAISDLSWLIIAAAGSFALTALGLLGFRYGVEFAQAVFLLALPLSVVWLLSVRTAFKIAQDRPGIEDLYLRLRRLRIAIQAIGLLAILVTSTWGMFINASVGVLGR
ncbi:component of SufBCD complex [Pseudooceanicola sediminis]|uniref:Component of SufBCD complex n=1 Tax=Pseudooceanicola sediminis TaxID=2211117 RepID=A0A399J7S9_9RHOB|nr:component of SufBCD complex [Pseudooceanicola sediminis]KAA2316972.1 component of SufBCD complex [Puniceibacterium sp. HSS470]RII40577.1 component of SufBCD complex [Pseudooceanicola sediminis]